MRKDLNREKMHKAIDSSLSGLNGDPWLFQRISAHVAEGETTVKKRLSAGLVLAIVFVLIAAVALAVTLLTHQEILEQVAVPLAVENDEGAGVNNTYNAGELAELVRSLKENGITLEENNRIMQALQNGQGYYEEEVIMEICRQAFGGNFYTWTLEQQDWYEELMVKIGFHETHLSRMPGEGNMTYEDAEAFAFRTIREKYGPDLPLEDRSIWQLSRQFYLEDFDDPSSACWSFTLDPRDLEHGRYDVWFADSDPESTAYVNASIRDWTKNYSGDELFAAFEEIYSWSYGQWPQEAWQKLHEMLQNAQISPDNREAQMLKAFSITEYPAPGEKDISREDAVRRARESLRNPRIAFDGAVLTEYEGTRTWIVSFLIHQEEGKNDDDTAGLYAVSVSSTDGSVLDTRKQGMDDTVAFAYVPAAAYEKAWEGILRPSEIIRLAADEVRKEYPELDLLNEEKYETLVNGYINWYVTFRSRDILLGDVSAVVSMDGTVSDIDADTEPLSGDNLLQRFRHAYGYYGSWNQSVWVQLEKQMSEFSPDEIGAKLLKATHYPEECSVKIQHAQAQELGILATGKRAAEVNTCVLVGADPHPVWIMRIMTDEDDDPVIGIDAETGDVVFTEQFKVDYTPAYTLYSMPETWRKAELETLGAPYVARTAITHAFADMSLDEPDLGLENEKDWELQQDGLVVRYIGRWKGMKSYEVELDKNGSVLRCEEKDSASTEEKPETGEPDEQDEFWSVPTPTPLPDGKPWFWGMDFAPQEFWNRLAAVMETHGITADNLADREKDWSETFGDPQFWPQEYQAVHYIFLISDSLMAEPPAEYATFPDPERKSKEEIAETALSAFHGIADAQMGKEWVDSLKTGIWLYSDLADIETGVYYGKPVWWVTFTRWDESLECWDPKGYAALDEDGNVLKVMLDLYSNG